MSFSSNVSFFDLGGGFFFSGGENMSGLRVGENNSRINGKLISRASQKQIPPGVALKLFPPKKRDRRDVPRVSKISEKDKQQ